MPIGPDTDRFGVPRMSRDEAEERMARAKSLSIPEEDRPNSPSSWVHPVSPDDFEAFLQSPIPKLSSDGGK